MVAFLHFLLEKEKQKREKNMRNRKGQVNIRRIGIGSLLGIISFIIMSFGASLNNVWMIRGGIVGVTFASWLVSWK
jgi:hypothetical protein